MDLVDLCVPTTLHASLAVAAARAGKHVVVEKPLTGAFASAATPRGEMLRQALAASDQVIPSNVSGPRLPRSWICILNPPALPKPRMGGAPNAVAVPRR